MNVQDLTDQIAEKHSLSRADARDMLATVVERIIESAKAGEEFSWPGFGKFKVRDQAARKARNPATGETIDVAASRKFVFQPAKALKDSLNEKSAAKSANARGKAAAKSAPKAAKAGEKAAARRSA
jgi:DNA-binding protein HU-beta